MKSDFFFKIIVLIIFIYAIIGFIYNYINTIVLFFLALILTFIYILTQQFGYVVEENKWRFLATIGSITTAISLLINANVFISNQRTQVDQTAINFFRIASDSFSKIDDNFMREPNKLGFLYHSIYNAYGNPYSPNLEKTRDMDLEFKQALKIFNVMEVVFIAGKLDERKDNPEYRGVINLFDIYASSPVMKEYWKTLRYNFTPDFIKFIETEFYNYRISRDVVFIQ